MIYFSGWILFLKEVKDIDYFINLFFMAGKLYLLPSTIGSSDWESVIPLKVIEITRELKFFVVEDIRTARRYLSKIKVSTPINDLNFQVLNEHTKPEEIFELIQPMLDGYDIGILSEAGMPVIADPGSKLVDLAHKKGIKVVPLTGPSSIFLTLVASGLNGQNFAFVGYLPVKPNERQHRIKQLEQLSLKEKQTQIFIETPYRNIQVLQDLFRTCLPETYLTIGIELTTLDELIITKKIRDWKSSIIPDINKKNAVFCIMA